MKNLLMKIIRKKDYSTTDDALERIVTYILTEIDNGNYDFSANCDINTFTQQGSTGKKWRKIYSLKKDSIECAVCEYLKLRLDTAFRIKYASRQKVISALFNTMSVIKDLHDFVIIRFDFKSFFDSVKSEFILDRYILNSSLSRKDKDIFKVFCKTFSRCFAGLQTSNAMTEIACRDFDEIFKSRLRNSGVMYYERYVDDVLVIFNKYIPEDNALEIIRQCIKSTFLDDSVRINDKKFYYISNRDMGKRARFDFLGYLFNLINQQPNKNLTLKFGITQAKIKRYTAKIRNILIAYKKDGDVELLRHRLKMFSCRIVYSRILDNKNYEWHARGLVVNYQELRFHLSDLDNATLSFLRYVYLKEMKGLGISIPYFMKGHNLQTEESIYNIYSNLKRNRSIMLDRELGIRIEDLQKIIRKVKPNYQCFNKAYHQVALDYLEMLEI